ncbi:helix-turn-helix transcriptional regulator [Halovivax gelatinilyticus]|uniref:helix-turn-helix transcriptional regulator n=1 Tax=Halovivax gelatinilyticus TaxID=2961597 RepID=UPI0020CA464A|nr:hypothetical protein [Halovivax gelatinilyticus]
MDRLSDWLMMAVWPTRTLRVVLCGMLIGALVVGVGSVGLVAGFTDEPSGHDSAAAVSGSAAATADEHDSNETAHLDGFDRIVTTFDVAENGTANVVVTYRYELDTNETDEEWETLREDIENRSTAYAAGEHERWNATLQAARNGTEREMSITPVTVAIGEVTTPRTYGTVTYTFSWSGFASVEPKWIGIGDALSQYTLDEGTTLWIRWPEAYELQEISPSPDHDRETGVGWDGEETDFIDGEPRVEVLERGEPVENESDDPDDRSLVPFVLAGLVLLGAAAAIVWWSRRDDQSAPSSEQPTRSAPTTPPPELLSNEERVLTLLADNGGRMKQQTIVAELGWTEAKTSQVVGELREAGDVEVFRLGRENVLALPEDDSADSG